MRQWNTKNRRKKVRKLRNFFRKTKNKFFFPQQQSYKKTNALVPPNKWTTYDDLVKTNMNRMNQSGYWGEFIVVKQLQAQGYLIEENCNWETKYGELDIIAYKKKPSQKNIAHIQFHEVKTVRKNSVKQNLDVTVQSQMRHLLSVQQRKGGKYYVHKVLTTQAEQGNADAKKLLEAMKYAPVQYFMHKVVIDTKGNSIEEMRRCVEWNRVKKQSIVLSYIKNLLSS